MGHPAPSHNHRNTSVHVSHQYTTKRQVLQSALFPIGASFFPTRQHPAGAGFRLGIRREGRRGAVRGVLAVLGGGWMWTGRNRAPCRCITRKIGKTTACALCMDNNHSHNAPVYHRRTGGAIRVVPHRRFAFPYTASVRIRTTPTVPWRYAGHGAQRATQRHPPGNSNNRLRVRLVRNV